ncbi:uncharacterized protein ISCGN_018069 [Ixodes scapularis]
MRTPHSEEYETAHHPTATPTAKTGRALSSEVRAARRELVRALIINLLNRVGLDVQTGDDDNNTAKVDYEDYEGKADELFQFLETLENGTILYTIKRSYEKNIQATTGTKTITCIEATVMYAEKSSAGLCTIFKTREENATAPFVATYQRTGPETILGEPGFDRMTVHYVGKDEQCLIVQHMSINPFDDALRSCDMEATLPTREKQTYFLSFFKPMKRVRFFTL